MKLGFICILLAMMSAYGGGSSEKQLLKINVTTMIELNQGGKKYNYYYEPARHCEHCERTAEAQVTFLPKKEGRKHLEAVEKFVESKHFKRANNDLRAIKEILQEHANYDDEVKFYLKFKLNELEFKNYTISMRFPGPASEESWGVLSDSEMTNYMSSISQKLVTSTDQRIRQIIRRLKIYFKLSWVIGLLETRNRNFKNHMRYKMITIEN